ncbi:phosphofurin acidic cluster sorting protein 1-like isoform X3 [Symsagittifera roscoffensis]|uniref:phosphofurin acidic cluster sorting protein 1-like isoform X3 n=1 Tax=Symsagittifera roscoffensis TaxID=84072 RepID=UPI00307BDEF9
MTGSVSTATGFLTQQLTSDPSLSVNTATTGASSSVNQVIMASATAQLDPQFSCGTPNSLPSSATNSGVVAVPSTGKNQPESMQMNVFTQLEDRGPRSMQRSCKLTVAKLALNKSVQSISSLTSIYIAVQFQSNKKTYRSPEIHLNTVSPSTPSNTVSTSSSSVAANIQNIYANANALGNLPSTQQSQCIQSLSCATTTSSSVSSSTLVPSSSERTSSSSQLSSGVASSTVGGISNSQSQAAQQSVNNSGVAGPMLSSSDLFFEIQPNFQVQMVYSHSVKKERGGNHSRDSRHQTSYNQLAILIQRRNRIKGTTILGYKTVASCQIDMSLVLQRGAMAQLEYDLLSPSSSSNKDRSSSTNNSASLQQQSANVHPPSSGTVGGNCEVVGRLSLSHLSTQPFGPNGGAGGKQRGNTGSAVGSNRRHTEKALRRRRERGDSSPNAERNRVARSNLARGASMTGQGAVGGGGNISPGDEYDSELSSLSEAEDDHYQARDMGSNRRKKDTAAGVVSGSGHHHAQPPVTQQTTGATTSRQQRAINFKQKLIRVLKKMKQQQEEEGEEDGCDDLDDDILPEELDDLDEFDSNSDLDSTHLALGLGDALGDTNSLDSHTADLLLPTDIRPEIKPFFNSHVQLNEDDNDNRGDITGTGDGQGGGGGSVASQYQMMQGVEYTRDRDREQQSCGLPGGADTDVQYSDGNNRLNSDEDNLRSSRSGTASAHFSIPVSSSGGGGGGGGSPEPTLEACEDSSSTEQLKIQLNTLFPLPNSQSASTGGTGGGVATTGNVGGQTTSSATGPVVPPKCVVVGRDTDPLCGMLQLRNFKVLRTRPQSDIVLVLEHFLNFLRHALYSNTPRSVPTLRVLIVGGERYVALFVQNFVNLFSKKSQDLPRQMQFLLLPGTHFSMLRACDNMGFLEKFSEYFTKLESAAVLSGGSGPTTGGGGVGGLSGGAGGSVEYSNSLAESVVNYMEMPKSTSLVNLPISEALLHFVASEDHKDASGSTKQVFVPFLNYLRLGSLDTNTNTSNASNNATTSQTIPHQLAEEEEEPERYPPSPPDPQSMSHHQHLLQHQTSFSSSTAPTHSPSQNLTHATTIQGPMSASGGAVSLGDGGGGVSSLGSPTTVQLTGSGAKDSSGNTSSGGNTGQISSGSQQQQQVTPSSTSGSTGGTGSVNGSGSISSGSEFQIDVWDSKLEHQTIKGHISYLHIQRTSLSCFSVQLMTKEKKRMGIKIKKNKDKEKDRDRTQLVELEGVTRLLCSCKAPSSAAMTTLVIDGCQQFPPVKFFQVSHQWPTHVKSFPVLLPGATPLAP